MISHYDRLAQVMEYLQHRIINLKQVSSLIPMGEGRRKSPDAICKSSKSGTDPPNLLTARTAESAGTQKRAFYLKKCFRRDFQPITSES